MSRILVAGAHGFLGRYICAEAVRQGHQVIGLSGQLQSQGEEPGMQTLPVRLEDPGLLYDKRLIDRCQGTEIIINASGPGDPGLPRLLLSQLHVHRTSQLLGLALRIPTVKQFLQVSSVAIAGDHVGLFTETMRSAGQQFKSGIGAAYLAAEHCVAGTEAPFSRVVGRFGVLVGDSKTGFYPRLSGVYKILAATNKLRRFKFLLERLGMIVLPFSEQGRCHLIPVDCAGAAALNLACQASTDQSLKTYHVLGGSRGVSMRRLLDLCFMDAGLDVEIFAAAESRWGRGLFEKMGFNPTLVEALTTRAFWTQERFAELMPDFRIPSLADLSPILLSYARGQLLKGDTL